MLFKYPLKMRLIGKPGFKCHIGNQFTDTQPLPRELDSLVELGAFVADGEARRVWQFAAIYLVVCYASVACWVYVGTFLRE